MNAREILKILNKDGWYEVSQEGSHMQLKHDKKPGKVTVPCHNGDLGKSVVSSIYKQARLK